MPTLSAFEALMDCIHDEIQTRANHSMIADVANLATMRRDLVVMERTLGPVLPVVRYYASFITVHNPVT